jgi:AraC family transcriptional regulator
VLLSGAMQESIAGRPFTLEPWQLLVKPAGIEHANAYGGAGARSLIVEFLAPLTLQSGWREASGVATVRALQMYEAFCECSSATPLMAEEIAVELSHSVSSMRRAEAGAIWLHRVRDRVHAEFAPPPPLRDLAIEHGVHPVSLSRAFARVFGCSIGQYARRRQLATVVEQLRSRVPLSLAALNAGFYDQSHLGRILRREFGCTPGWLAKALRRGFGSS